MWLCIVPATSFNEARAELGGHELTARINLLPAPSPENSLELRIQEIEEKRSKDERNVFREVVNITSYGNACASNVAGRLCLRWLG